MRCYRRSADVSTAFGRQLRGGRSGAVDDAVKHPKNNLLLFAREPSNLLESLFQVGWRAGLRSLLRNVADELADSDAERSSELEKQIERGVLRSAFVILDSLRCDAEEVCELTLSKPTTLPQLDQPLSERWWF